MSRRRFAAAGMALAFLLVSSALDTADAEHRGSRAFHNRVLHGGHGRVFATDTFEARRLYRNPVETNPFVAGPPPIQGAHVFGDSCHRFRRRALATGSRTWWARYDACLEGYY